jgi:2-keto-4-pentenoate hydratase/2-oxohepta-3-ene-1,7-dioic acid hydratase in catechol pathway
MRLATFEDKNNLHWGFVFPHPETKEDWIVEPQKVQKKIEWYISTKTNPFLYVPSFFPKQEWPKTLRKFLEEGDEAMYTLQQLETFALHFMEQTDAFILLECAYRAQDVKLCAPIPSPRLLLGIVGNNPAFIRNHLNTPHVNLVPQGHLRHQCTALGANEPIVCAPMPNFFWAYNVELGIVIGKKAKNVPIEEAMDYVAGYTNVIDSVGNPYLQAYPEITKLKDIYSVLAYDWAGKAADASCPIGPYLVTKDEIGHPYNLSTINKMNGLLRDRANTCSMLVGIERAIAYYSSFMTLQPGDVLHMGASGKDGLNIERKHKHDTDIDVLECEIEKLGTLHSPIVYKDIDWRDSNDESKALHVSATARQLIKNDACKLDAASQWNLSTVRNYAAAYGNYKNVKEVQGIECADIGRYFWVPPSALGKEDLEEFTFEEGYDLEISIELAFVVSRIAKEITEKDASNHILGFIPLLSLTNNRLRDALISPSLIREPAIVSLYKRWNDGCAIVSGKPTAITGNEEGSITLTLSVNGTQTLNLNTANYVHLSAHYMEIITKYSTLLPGDVISLGQLGETYILPAEKLCQGKHSLMMTATGLPDIKVLL